MKQLMQNCSRTRIAKALRSTAAAALSVAVLCQPNFASAAPHGGGGGSHGGGGFHGGGFGFHGGGFHGGGFHAGGFHGGGFRSGWHGGFAGTHTGFGGEGHWNYGWHNGRYGYWWGNGLGTYEGSYPDYSYYDYSQPYASQTWYYCSDPAGYYPYVTQCNTGWQTVPAS
jgi:hypothetical protein